MSQQIRSFGRSLSDPSNLNHQSSRISLSDILSPTQFFFELTTEIILRTKLTQTYTYYKFIHLRYISNSPTRNPQKRFMFICSKYISPYFLNFTYCIETINFHGILRIYDPIRQMYLFCPLAITFPIDDAGPLVFTRKVNTAY